jgi:hypothetical protein
MRRSRLPLLPANHWIATLALCSGLTLYAAFVPLARACFRAEILTNEGWNIYHAITVANRQQLYPVKYGWITDNYPMLSFAIMAWLHRFTHDYLFTARAVSVLSLLAVSAFAGLIVLRLTKSRHAAVLAGLFCIAIFCANAPLYVGSDEPQMLAQAFFMGGFYLVIAADAAAWALVAAALIFAVGGSIKHNLIDFPIAVLIATALRSGRRAALFAGSGLVFAAAAVWLNFRFGGPHFLDELLLPRGYSWLKAASQVGTFLGPVLLPALCAAWKAWSLRQDARARILSIHFAAALLLGFYFSGGSGVSINAQFSVLIGMSMLLGLLFADIGARRAPWTLRPAAAWLPVGLFAWLLIPLLISGNWNPAGALRQTEAAQQRFARHAAFLRGHPGPTICESALLCVSAGKPFLYDAFNATRLIELDKLNQQPMLDALRDHRIAAVELDGPVDEDVRHDRFSPGMLAAIQQYYTPVVHDPDAIIYLPRSPQGAP